MTVATVFGGDPAFPDLSDPRSFVDGVPYEAFARMRELPGLHWQPTTVATANGGFWAVTRWNDIVAIEKDTASFTSTRGSAYPLTNAPLDHPFARSLINQDPPRHGVLRRAVARGFGPRVVANFEPWVQGVVSDVVDGIEGLDRFDFVTEVGQVVPARVIARVLGVPAGDESELVALVLAAFATIQDTDDADGEAAGTGVVEALRAQWAFAERVQELKRAYPADDMVTELNACIERGELAQQDFLVFFSTLMGAGFETTHTTISQSMRMVVESSEVREATIRALDQGLGDRVVDEYVRLVSPVMEMARTATRDLELAGEQIRANDVLVLYYASANRDPAVFTSPDAFDPWREETETLAFGTGPHRCLGSYLAKLEVRLLWQELHRRGLTLRLDGEPERGWSVFINQLRSLPVAWA